MSLLTTIQSAAEELGIRSPASVTGSSDTTTKRLYRLALRAAKDLRDEHDWSILNRSSSVTSVGNASIPVPSDIARIINDTVWNNNDSWRLVGHEYPATWQHRLQGWSVSTQHNAAFRIFQASGQKYFEFDPAPASGEIISFEYITSNMFDTGSVFTDEWSADGYTCLLDEDLIAQSLIWRTLRSIGRDWQSHRLDYERELHRAISQDVPAGAIALGRESSLSLNAIVPDTGYG